MTSIWKNNKTLDLIWIGIRYEMILMKIPFHTNMGGAASVTQRRLLIRHGAFVGVATPLERASMTPPRRYPGAISSRQSLARSRSHYNLSRAFFSGSLSFFSLLTDTLRRIPHEQKHSADAMFLKVWSLPKPFQRAPLCAHAIPQLLLTIAMPIRIWEGPYFTTSGSVRDQKTDVVIKKE